MESPRGLLKRLRAIKKYQGLPENEILRLMENEATNNPRKFS
jgi:hypothetical protein